MSRLCLPDMPTRPATMNHRQPTSQARIIRELRASGVGTTARTPPATAPARMAPTRRGREANGPIGRRAMKPRDKVDLRPARSGGDVQPWPKWLPRVTEPFPSDGDAIRTAPSTVKGEVRESCPRALLLSTFQRWAVMVLGCYVVHAGLWVQDASGASSYDAQLDPLVQVMADDARTAPVASTPSPTWSCSTSFDATRTVSGIDVLGAPTADLGLPADARCSDSLLSYRHSDGQSPLEARPDKSADDTPRVRWDAT